MPLSHECLDYRVGHCESEDFSNNKIKSGMTTFYSVNNKLKNEIYNVTDPSKFIDT